MVRLHRRQFLALAAGSLYAGPLEDRIRRIESRWVPDQASNRHHTPGVSMAVIRNGALEWSRAYGVAISRTTLFQAASISKPVAAAAALRMVQDGLFTLDQNVNDKLQTWKVPDNEFTREKKVTVRGLLSHSAGLTIHGFPGYAEHEALPTVQQILDGAPPANTKAVRVESVPGSTRRYSGGGYTVLQLLMAETGRRPFPELMQRLILQPAAMGDSGYEQPLPEGRAAHAAVGFHETGRSYTGGWHTYPEMAAAGLWTTPTDLCRFAIEIVNAAAGRSSRIISHESARLMTTPYIEEQALGFGVSKGSFSHGGANAGYRCMLTCRLDGSHGAVVMTNSDSGQGLIRPILDAIAAESGWPEMP